MTTYHRLVTKCCCYNSAFTVNFIFSVHVVKSFVEMTKMLLSQKDASLYLLSEQISQDRLENYFGQQRSRGRRSDNPSVKETIQNAMAIRVQKSLELDRVQGNCRRKRRVCKSLKITEDDDVPLPKRKRKSTH